MKPSYETLIHEAFIYALADDSHMLNRRVGSQLIQNLFTCSHFLGAPYSFLNTILELNF